MKSHLQWAKKISTHENAGPRSKSYSPEVNNVVAEFLEGFRHPRPPGFELLLVLVAQLEQQHRDHVTIAVTEKGSNMIDRIGGYRMRFHSNMKLEAISQG